MPNMKREKTGKVYNQMYAYSAQFD